MRAFLFLLCFYFNREIHTLRLKMSSDNEWAAVRQLSNKNLKDEIKRYNSNLGYQSTGLYDRHDLEKAVVEGRIQYKQRMIADNLNNMLTKANQAYIIQEEIKRIDQQLSYRDIINEIHSRHLEIDPLDDRKTLVTCLALARLNMTGTPISSPTSTTPNTYRKVEPERPIIESIMNKQKEIISNIFDVQSDLTLLKQKKASHKHDTEQSIDTYIDSTDDDSNSNDDDVIYEEIEYGTTSDSSSSSSVSSSSSTGSSSSGEEEEEEGDSLGNIGKLGQQSNSYTPFNNINNILFDQKDTYTRPKPDNNQGFGTPTTSTTYTTTNNNCHNIPMSRKKKVIIKPTKYMNKQDKLKYFDIDSIQFASELIMKSILGPIILTLKNILDPLIPNITASISNISNIATSPLLSMFYYIQYSIISVLIGLSRWAIGEGESADQPTTTTATATTASFNTEVDGSSSSTARSGGSGGEYIADVKYPKSSLLLFITTSMCMIFKRGIVSFILSFLVVRTVRLGILSATYHTRQTQADRG